MRYRVDGSWQRSGRVVLAGSPITMFRLSDGGSAVVDRLEVGDDIDRSRLTDRLLDAGAIHPEPVESSRFDSASVTIVTPQLGGAVSDPSRVVIDDGSEPPLTGATERLPTNRGPSAARNAGRAHVSTELLAFIDADVDLPVAPGDAEAESAWWAPLLRHFDDDRVALVAPRVIGDPGSSLDLGDRPARIRAGTRVGYVPAAMVIVRTSAFDDVGGFDEMLRFGEDVDFVWRLDQAGWRCRYEPASTVSHRPRATRVERLRQQVGYGSSSAPLALRHTRALAPFRADGWTAATWTLGMSGHPVAAVGLAATRVAAMLPKLSGVPAATVIGLAATSHLAAGRQLAMAARRAWWPLLVVAGLGSRRARRLTVLAALVSPRTIVNDAAFGWGVWKSVLRLRVWSPLVPDIAVGPVGQRRR